MGSVQFASSGFIAKKKKQYSSPKISKRLETKTLQYNSLLNKQNKMLYAISFVSELSTNLFQASLLSMFNEVGSLERYSVRNEGKPDQYC